MAKTFRPSVITLVLAAVLPFCACKDPDQIKKVKLQAAGGPGETGAGVHEAPPLRICVASILSPEFSFMTYGELAQYLGKRLKHPVKVVFKKNYAAANDSLKNSESDVAFICTGGYLAARETFKPEILAVPVVNGTMVYNSLIVARKSGPERELGDLKGKVFAFSDVFSLTGRMYIQARLADLEQPPGFFGGTVFTGSHDNSVKAVAKNFADAACINSLVYKALLERDDLYAKKLMVLETSPSFGNPPVVAREGLSPDIKKKLRAIFLDMHMDEEGKRVLKAISIERFSAPEPGLYSSAERVYARAAAGKNQRE